MCECECVAHSWWEKGRSCEKMKSCPTTHFETAKCCKMNKRIYQSVNRKYNVFLDLPSTEYTTVRQTHTHSFNIHTYTD